MRMVVSLTITALVGLGCAGGGGIPGPASNVPFSAAPVTAAPPSPSPAAPIPGPTSAPVLPMVDSLPPGTYRLDAELGITIDVPGGWATCCTSVIVKNDFTGLLYIDITDIVVYADPCAWTTGGTAEPRGAKAIAVALSMQAGRDGSAPRGVSVGGLPGFHVRLTVPADQPFTNDNVHSIFTGCDRGQYRSFDTAQNGTRYHQGPSQIDDFYIVDVGNSTVVFDLVSSPDVAASDLAELEAMLVSVDIG